MTDTTLDNLANQAIEAAATGLRHYLNDRGHKVADDQWGPLTDCVKAHVKKALPEALDDAKAAFAAGMGAYAGPTFRSSLVVAGANAGKEFFGEA
jgi:hypothetical protein